LNLKEVNTLYIAMEVIEKSIDVITPALIDKAMTYEVYRNVVEKLFAENKATGDFMDNNSDVLHYTKMNIARMKRGDKTKHINEELSNLVKSYNDKQIWLVITEGWCGDAAQNIPIMVRLAALNPHIDIKFVFRHKNEKLMNAYLTDNTQSIPKLIILNGQTLEEIATWGPRPAVAQEITDAFKKNDSLSYDDYAQDLHKWYAKDKYQSMQSELLEVLGS